MALTVKQEAFCLAYIETGNASEAYRRAGYSTKAAQKTIHEAASRLLAEGKVSARVSELKAVLAEHFDITVERIAAMLQEDRQFARECSTPAAAVSATMGLAKLGGLLIDKRDHTSSDGTMTPKPVNLAGLSDAALKEVASLPLPDDND